MSIKNKSDKERRERAIKLVNDDPKLWWSEAWELASEDLGRWE